MKTFEEKWTAWLDDQLSSPELEAFEATLPNLDAARAEKRDAKKLGSFLKEELAARTLSNEEFFSHQLRDRIARETEEEDQPRSRSTWWTVPRLVWCGATALALFLLTTFVFLGEEQPGEQSDYLTQILNSRVDSGVNPNATVSIFESKTDNKVTVLWTEGLQSLPADYAAK